MCFMDLTWAAGARYGSIHPRPYGSSCHEPQLGRRNKTLPCGVETTEKRASTTEPAAGRGGGSSATANATPRAREVAAASAPVEPGERASGAASPGKRRYHRIHRSVQSRPSVLREHFGLETFCQTKMNFQRPEQA